MQYHQTSFRLVDWGCRDLPSTFLITIYPETTVIAGRNISISIAKGQDHLFSLKPDDTQLLLAGTPLNIAPGDVSQDRKTLNNVFVSGDGVCAQPGSAGC